MANSIKRIITMGIAKESTFNVAEASPTYVLPNVEATFEPDVRYVENKAMLGSTHGTSASMLTIKDQKVDFKMKIDEDVYGLLLLQNFTDSVSASAGETVVYDHTFTYANTNNGASYTLFIQDDERGDLIISGFRYENMTVTPTIEDFVMVQITGVASLEASGAVTNSITTLREFVGRHASFKTAEYGSSLASFSLLTAEYVFSSPLVDDSARFALGSASLVNNSTLATEMTSTIGALYPDETYKDLYMAGTAVHSELTITDTARFVTGSVASTSPSIKFTAPHQNITAGSWTGAGADELMKQEMTYTTNDMPGVTDAPMKIEITNAVASY